MAKPIKSLELHCPMIQFLIILNKLELTLLALPLVSQQSACSQKTTSRHCCSIPFKYNGVTYNSCTKTDWHTYWCSLDPVYRGRWGNCGNSFQAYN